MKNFNVQANVGSVVSDLVQFYENKGKTSVTEHFDISDGDLTAKSTEDIFYNSKNSRNSRTN